mgnify:CR=1 FL=1
MIFWYSPNIHIFAMIKQLSSHRTLFWWRMVYLLSSMNRGELVQSLVEETGLPKNVVRAVVNALPTVVAKGIREGESISMKGFGSFVPWQQSERLARNPKTGEEVMITPRVSVKFKAGSDLLKELNE